MKDFPDIDFKQVTTYSIRERKSLVQTATFATPWQKGGSLADFLATLPEILAGAHFRAIVASVAAAVKAERPVVLAMGAHVIKCGLSPLMIDLMERGIVSAVALNGAGMIHDYELAATGQTSEDVAAALATGEFGMGRETGEFLNTAINQALPAGLGIGAAVGQALIAAKLPHLRYSLVAAGHRLGIPVTVHVAIGTDIIHTHPSANGAALGAGTHHDFRRLIGVIARLEGGVYFNIGSAVMLPEIFLKAVSTVRNLGYPLKHFTTVNLDFLRQYRPTQNVVSRPTADGGAGYALIGHHELLLPLLAAAIIESV